MGFYDDIKVPDSTYLIQNKNLGVFSVHTTISDYLKWIINYRTGKVGGDETLKIIETGIHQDPDAWNWAFGFQKTKHKGLRQKLSQGLVQGYRSHASYFPEEDVSIIYFTNDGEWRSFYLANKITDVLFKNSIEQKKIESRYSAEQDKTANEKSVKPNSVEFEKSNSLEGVYFNDKLSRNFSIKKTDLNLEFNLFGQEPIILKHIAKNEFETEEWYMNKIVFTEDENGMINSCKVYNSRNGEFVLFNKISHQ